MHMVRGIIQVIMKQQKFLWLFGENLIEIGVQSENERAHMFNISYRVFEQLLFGVRFI